MEPLSLDGASLLFGRYVAVCAVVAMSGPLMAMAVSASAEALMSAPRGYFRKRTGVDCGFGDAMKSLHAA